MSKKIAVLGSLVAIVSLALAGCGAVPPATAAVQSTEGLRTISVAGQAQVPLTPDIAYIQIGVHTQSERVASAVDENNSTIEAVKATLMSLGVAEKDLQTTNFSIYRSDQWSPDGSTFGPIYSVDNTLYVTVRALDSMGQLLSAAIDAGANNIYGIQFDAEDKSAALSLGRNLAVQAAAAQAQELASATGVDLGDIRTITYYSGSYASPYYGFGGGGGGGAAAEQISISAGQLTLNVEVNIVYDITP